MILITTYNSINSIDYTTTILQLETALCYQHYFCNTELRTTIITKIKGLSIQTQQNTFVLFTLFKLTSDERKTLTKISTCKTSHNHSPNQRTLRTRRNKKTSKQPNKEKEEKAVCTSSKGLVTLIGFSSAFSGWVLNRRHRGQDLMCFSTCVTMDSQ